jgi:hypothetical protein
MAVTRLTYVLTQADSSLGGFLASDFAGLVDRFIVPDVPMFHRDLFARFQEQARDPLVRAVSAIEHSGVPAK